METRLKIIELEDTVLEFYNGYVISKVKEGVIFEDNHVEQILNLCNEVFDSRSFVYISNRKEAYNVNPLIYSNLRHLEKLAGIAIVNYELMGVKTAHFEKQFSPLPFDIFTNMDEAIAWSKSLLNKK
ncbi:hypothetical protein [Salegentibacter sp.]|uniref:hypothetical protein n=1 Tax=Salegentibacter sp. TaxID=1903072 RepID=UPI0035634B75